MPPKQGRFPRSRGADEANGSALRHLDVNALEHLDLPERLVDALDRNRSGHETPDAARFRRSRAINQSVVLVSGIVSARKSTAVQT